MARPDKIGIDYFSFDVDFFEDEKIMAISGEFGLKGEITAVKLLCAIYRNGYFILWNELMKYKLLKSLPGVSLEMLESIVNRLALWGFFDKELLDSVEVLTSRGIQERYFKATERRKRREDFPYLLVNVCNNEVNVYNNGVNVCKNPPREELMYAKTPQSKVKENIKKIPPEGGTKEKPETAFSFPKPPHPAVPYQEIIDMWNSTCVNYHRLTSLSDKRRNKVSARYAELAKMGEPLPLLQTLFAKMQDSPFLQGGNGRGWKATFDWLFSNGTNWVKVYEGQYDDSPPACQKPQRQGIDWRGWDREMDRQQAEYIQRLKEREQKEQKEKGNGV